MVGFLERGLQLSDISCVLEFFELEFVNVFHRLVLPILKPNEFLLKVSQRHQHIPLFILHLPQLQVQLAIHGFDLAFSNKLRLRGNLLQLVHPKVIELFVADFAQRLNFHFKRVELLVHTLVLLVVVLGLGRLPGLLLQVEDLVDCLADHVLAVRAQNVLRLVVGELFDLLF